MRNYSAIFPKMYNNLQIRPRNLCRVITLKIILFIPIFSLQKCLLLYLFLLFYSIIFLLCSSVFSFYFLPAKCNEKNSLTHNERDSFCSWYSWLARQSKIIKFGTLYQKIYKHACIMFTWLAEHFPLRFF